MPEADTRPDVVAAPTVDAPAGTGTDSSRQSAGGAGWGCTRRGTFNDLVPARPPRTSWLDPRVLWRCRNDMLATLADPVPAERARWVGGRSDADLTVDLSPGRGDGFSFLLMGDTGEGDRSQFAVVPPLLAHAPSADFLFICSDVLYPIGDVNDYAAKFYQPYTDVPVPIYAIPGNHDWYDNLHAFMYHLCGRTRDPERDQATVPDATGSLRSRVRTFVRRTLWRRPSRPDEAALTSMKQLRRQTGQSQPVPQPGPYYVIDTEQLRLVCIDTGILGTVDRVQGEWLVRVSSDPRPKILLTGRPLVVDGHHDDCVIEGGAAGYATVLEVVHDPGFHYVASVGGDVHNYQRYPVRLEDGRTVQHLVAGGGGAFMHATHLIGEVRPEDACGVTEDEFRCYPLRRDSLAAYSRVVQGMLDRLHVPFRVDMTPDEAAALLTEHLGMQPLASRPVGPRGPGSSGRHWTRLERTAARLLMLSGGKGFHKSFSPFCDWDTPPFFKSFLRIDVGPRSAVVRCLGVTGCGETEADPPVEDRFELTW